MAYLSLYRKYRPQSFSEILGQEHVSSTLSNTITEDRVSHAYLFTGPRGTGKTSTARILAKALNCEKGPTPDPCGVCPACVSITDGSSLDVIEMDAASHSKVDETRDILAGVPLASAGGRRKVYVIDEVHMLSAGSFNALLKTLEEPPGHVLFILATTEAHKVLPTIISRTQRFDFRRVPAEIVEDHLAQVAKLETIDIDQSALAFVARHSEGSVRDALSALDQLSSLQGHISAEEAERMLGERSEEVFFEMFDAIVRSDPGGVFSSLHQLVAQGADPRQLALGVLQHARSLLLVRTAPDAAGLLDVSEEDRAGLLAQSENFTNGTLMRILDLVAKAITEMRNSPNHRLLLEVALVRAAAPETDPSADGLHGSHRETRAPDRPGGQRHDRGQHDRSRARGTGRGRERGGSREEARPLYRLRPHGAPSRRPSRLLPLPSQRPNAEHRPRFPPRSQPTRPRIPPALRRRPNISDSGTCATRGLPPSRK